jgi:type I restriction enzyme R subunit
MVRELSPLMKYYEPPAKKVIQINAPDFKLSHKTFVNKIREDEKLNKFLAENLLIRKIKGGGISAYELVELKKQLSELDDKYRFEIVERYRGVDFLRFLLEVIKLSAKTDPEVCIKKRFDKFILENTHYNSRQLEFLLVLRSVFSKRVYVELSSLAERPLADEQPLERFREEELREIVDRCNQIRVI